jgi:hypothetical protein
MKIDLGFIGRIIGYVVGLIMLGALVSTGIFRLAGHGAARLPEAVGDFYGGMTGKEAKLTVPGGQVKVGPLTLDLGGAKSLTLPESESGKEWRGVPTEGEQAGITWESVVPTPASSGQTAPVPSAPTAPSAVVPSGPSCEVAVGVMKYSGEFTELGRANEREAGTLPIVRWLDQKWVEVRFYNGTAVVNSRDTGVACTGTAVSTAPSAPTIITGPSRECVAARGTLKGLQGSPDPAKIKAAAEAVLATCSDTDSVATANAALEVAVTEMARREAEAAAHQTRLDAWKNLETTAATLGTNSTYYDSVRAVILAAGGTFHLEKIEGLQPGVFRSMCGGGEICTIFVHPPADIDGEVSAITLRVELQALFDWGVGHGPSGFLGKCSLPVVPADYTLGGP